MFLSKYRNLFNEKSTIFDEAVIRKDYSTIQIPPNYSIKKIVADVKYWYSKKEVKLRTRKTKKGNSRSTADIVLDLTSEDVMKRLFHILRINQTMTNLTNLDIYFQRMKSMNKKFVIPDIQRINAKGGVGGKTTKTSRQDYESEIRSTQRDIRFYKILLLNLCKGVFPKCDNLI